MPFYFNPVFPMENYPNVNSMQNYDIKELEIKVNKLDKEICSLKERINKLEKYNNYNSNYQSSSYNMM